MVVIEISSLGKDWGGGGRVMAGGRCCGSGKARVWEMLF